MEQGIARLASRAQLGLRALPVSVEVHLGAGLPSFSIVGLAETAVKESKERVRSALTNSGFEFPAGRITVNLSPADLPKEGGRFDLPIALGILLASGQLACTRAAPESFGELALDGELRPVPGLLIPAAAIAQELAQAGSAGPVLLVPAANLAEVSLATGRAVGARHLLEVCAWLRGEGHLMTGEQGLPSATLPTSDALLLDDIRGQALGKRAACIAAAGAHGLLLVGPPGSGKSMLAQGVSALLPPLAHSEALVAAAILAASGQGFDPGRFGVRPFRAPHHTTSAHAMIGGGRRAAPGEVTLAHSGILFLDELPEFDRRGLEALREPLETGVVTIARADWRAEFPAGFQLVAAMNPCPCGHLGDERQDCRCSPARIAQYRNRLSGPLLDRIDLRVELTAVPAHELLPGGAGPSAGQHARMRLAVASARSRQLARRGVLNARLSARDIASSCPMDRAAERCLAVGHEKLKLTARGYHRTIKVAQTIADLEGSELIGATHVAEALQMRRALAD